MYIYFQSLKFDPTREYSILKNINKTCSVPKKRHLQTSQQ